MSQMVNKALFILLITAIVLITFGCGDQRTALFNPDTGEHPNNWVSIHPAGYSLDECTQCHGEDYKGGISGVSCFDCHLIDPRVSTGSGCTFCHGQPPATNAHLAHVNGTNGYTAGFDCSECHKKPQNYTDPGHFYDGVYDTTRGEVEVIFGPLAKTNGAPATYDHNTMTCDVYCHDESYFENGWGTGTAPQWNDSGYLTGNASHDCAQCHGYPPAGGHPAATSTDCINCHSHVNATGDGFTDVTLHVDGVVEGGGDCIGCHAYAVQHNVRRAVASDFSKTSHHVATGMPSDALTCEACHGDLLTDQSHPSQNVPADPQVQVADADTGNYYVIDPSTNDATLVTFCLSCHDADGATRLGANALQPFADSNDFTAPPDVNAAWTQQFNHSSGAVCNSCHGDNSAAGTTTDPQYNMHGSSNQKLLREANVYQVCFQCHNTTITKTNTASEQYMDNNFAVANSRVYQSKWNTIPNIQSQFSTTNYAYHPVLGIGRNQPADNLNSDWTASNYAKADSGCPDGTCTGLDNNFVDGWESTSLVTCTDCHNNAGTGARGPHGSAQPWILKGMDTTVTVTTVGAGTIQPNAGAPTNLSYIAANFCVNCHRADIYGWGSKNNNGPAINNQTFSRVSHRGGALRKDDHQTYVEAQANGKTEGGYRNIGCMNCHGGGEVAGIHGSSLGVGTDPQNPNQQLGDEMGKRFMNGNSWQAHVLGDQTGQKIGCYTGTPPALGVTLSGCNHHSGGKLVTPNYYYQWQ